MRVGPRNGDIVISHFLIFTLLLFSMCGCNLTPKPHVLKSLPAPALDEAQQAALAEASFVSDGWFDEEWWRLFKDPQLDALIAQSLANNPSIDVAEARIGIAKATASLATAPLFPRMDFSADTIRLHQSKNGVFGILAATDPLYPLTYTQNDLTANFSYEFDFFKKHKNQIIASLDEVEALKAEAYIARLSLAISVAYSYFQLNAAKARERLAAQLVRNRESMFSLVQNRLSHGIDAKLSINVSATNVLEAQQYLVRLSGNAESEMNELQAYLAVDFLVPIEDVDSSLSIEPFPLPSSLPLDLLGHRPDIWAQRWRVEAAARKICVAYASFYPNIDINGFIGLQALVPKNLFTWDSVAGLLYGPALHLPIFRGGAIRYEYNTRLEEYDLAVAQYDSLVLTATKEVLNALIALQKADEYYRIAVEIEELAHVNLEYAKRRLQYTINSKIDVLAVENQWIQTQDAKYQSYLDCLQARLILFKALGGGYELFCENSIQ